MCTQTVLVNIRWRGTAPKPIKLNELWLRYGVRCTNKYRSARPSTVHSTQTRDSPKCMCTSKHPPVHFLSTGMAAGECLLCWLQGFQLFLSSGCKRERSSRHALWINEHLSLRQSNALGEHTPREHACGSQGTRSTLCLIWETKDMQSCFWIIFFPHLPFSDRYRRHKSALELWQRGFVVHLRPAQAAPLRGEERGLITGTCFKLRGTDAVSRKNA